VYAKSTVAEIPAIEGRLRSIDSEIEAKIKRVSNLVTRISELPAEVPADPFYEQIKELNTKIAELKSVQADLRSKSAGLAAQTIDKQGLIQKIERTIKELERTPTEKRRPLYANLIKFAELHPTKIRVGVFAPTRPTPNDNTLAATGTEGRSSSQFVENEGSLLPFERSPRGGSTTVSIPSSRGAPRFARAPSALTEPYVSVSDIRLSNQVTAPCGAVGFEDEPDLR
jgi:ribosomal protein L29